MVAQHGVLLAVDLVADHFGRRVAKVCECLLRHGALPLPEIIRRAELSPGQVKNCLLVLIQHSCVQAFSTPRGGGDKTLTLYMAIFENITHRLRFQKFLAIVRSDLPESEALLEGLLQNGRLTFDQLVERTVSKVSEGSIAPTREEIRLNFNKLVFAHYVERCPKPEPFFDPFAEDQHTSTRRRGAKTFEKTLSLEQKAISAAALSDAERFSEIPCTMADTSNANHSTHHAVPGAKRKYEALEVDQELNPTIVENEVLWRANFEKFIFCLKKKVCAERKKPKLRVGTHAIWEAFFEASNTANVKDTNSVTSPIRGILERLGQKQGSTSMTLDQITRVLEELQCHPSNENPETFTLDLSKIVEVCRNDEIESLVKKKYGQQAFTIFRLLVTQGHPVETDKIADTTILEKKVVQETLYKLWKDDYIDTERILSGTGNTQLFVWKVKKAFREQFVDNLYHAALNLRQMISYITELQLEGSKDVIKLGNRKSILTLSLIKHDDSLMLFQDF